MSSPAPRTQRRELHRQVAAPPRKGEEGRQAVDSVGYWVTRVLSPIVVPCQQLLEIQSVSQEEAQPSQSVSQKIAQPSQ